MTVTVTGKAKVQRDFELQYGDVKKTRVFWRSDGGAVAVQVSDETGDPSEGPFVGQVFVVEVGGATQSHSETDRAAAKDSNALGMKHYKERAWSRAVAAFDLAILQDPSFVLPHYNLASVASIAGDIMRTRAQLQWLADSDDKIAKEKLKKAQTDPDLDFASTDPEVRKLIGVAPYERLEGDSDKILERPSGVWGMEGESCSTPWLTLTFKKKKEVTLRYLTECEEDGVVEKTFKGKWKENNDYSISLTIKGNKEFPAWPEGGWLEMVTCPGSEVTSSCFTVTVGDGTLGPFHRGLPEIPGGLRTLE
jgi:hypothetical protein